MLLFFISWDTTTLILYCVEFRENVPSPLIKPNENELIILIKLKCTEVFGGVIESTKLFYNSIMKVKRPQTVNFYEQTLHHYRNRSS